MEAHIENKETMSRRDALGSLFGVALGSRFELRTLSLTAPATYVLVHGAWHGGWCWKKVAPVLRNAGHEVYTPTLTGLGDRSHLGGPDVTLSTHIEDIVKLLSYENLERVILVGHSYAGMVITGVAERAPERLSHLVYLDAFVPEDGQSQVDITAPQREQRAAMEARVRDEGNGWALPSLRPGPWEPYLREQWRITDDADVHWMLARLTPHPFATMTEPVRRVNAAAAALSRTYIRCTAVPSASFDRFAAAARRPGSGWAYAELQSAHDAMITAPNELSAALMAIR